MKRMLFLQCKLMTRAGQQLTPHKPPTLTSVPPVQRGTHLFVGPLPASLVPGADAALSPLGVALSLPAQGDIRSDGQRAHRPEGGPEKPSDPPWGRGSFLEEAASVLARREETEATASGEGGCSGWRDLESRSGKPEGER